MSAESEVSIGKFDILATYSYAKALLDGVPADEAKQRGIVAAIMGAKARGSQTPTFQVHRHPHFASSLSSLTDTHISGAAVNNESGGVYDPLSQIFGRCGSLSAELCDVSDPFAHAEGSARVQSDAER